MYFVWSDDVFLPSDEAGRCEFDDFDREIEEFKRSVAIIPVFCHLHVMNMKDKRPSCR